MQATMVHEVERLTRQHFYDYIHNQKSMRGKLQMETLEMLNRVNAPPGQDNYDAQVYVPRIVDWWNNEKFDGQFKFKTFIFGSNGHYKPMLKYGPDDYTVPIILYLNEGHFDGVRKSGNLFGRPYCFSCEKPYFRASEHRKSCKARCIKWYTYKIQIYNCIHF